MTDRIVFNRPEFAGRELEYIARAVELGHISGDGNFTKSCQSLMEKELAVAKVLLTTSCTHALEMAALLLDIGEGDEVIVPSFTFVSTVNAFVLRGAQPVFIDIRPDTLNMDESILESLISKKTRAIVPVHYAGVGCQMDEVSKIANSYGIPLVEDNAHGLFARHCGQYLGTFGAFATQSFHETKNFHCGEGGALLINDPQYIERAEIIREKGTNRSRFYRGQVDKYTWVDVGSSYLPSDLLAAFLLAQLEERESILRRRAGIWQRYQTDLKEWAHGQGVGLPVIPPDCEHSSHIFYLLLPDGANRESLAQHLARENILAVHHYVPLHTSEMGARYGYKKGQLPVTERTSERLLRLPLYNGLSPDTQTRIIEAVKSFRVKPVLVADILPTRA